LETRKPNLPPDVFELLEQVPTFFLSSLLPLASLDLLSHAGSDERLLGLQLSWGLQAECILELQVSWRWETECLLPEVLAQFPREDVVEEETLADVVVREEGYIILTDVGML
jgi:hypothetical protein